MADDESLAEAWLRSFRFSKDSAMRATHHSNNFQMLRPVDLHGILSNSNMSFAPYLFCVYVVSLSVFYVLYDLLCFDTTASVRCPELISYCVSCVMLFTSSGPGRSAHLCLDFCGFLCCSCWADFDLMGPSPHPRVITY